MKEAYSIKLQRTVEASESDYPDYYGFLLCPYCNDVLFLRKSCIWRGQKLEAVFVHHAKTELSLNCEKRAKLPSTKKEIKAKYQSRTQQINRLTLSLWKHLKTNKALNLTNWTNVYREALGKKNTFFKITGALDDMLLQINIDKFWSYFEKVTHNAGLNDGTGTKEWLAQLPRGYYYRHLAITWDIFKILLLNKRFKEIRARLYSFIIHPQILRELGITDNDLGTSEFNAKVLIHCVFSFCFILISVDWQKILGEI